MSDNTAKPGIWCSIGILKYLSDMPRSQLAVYMALAARRNWKTGQCNPSTSTLAKDTNLNQRSVRRALAGLEKLKLVVRMPSHRPDGGLSSNHHILPQIQKDGTIIPPVIAGPSVPNGTTNSSSPKPPAPPSPQAAPPPRLPAVQAQWPAGQAVMTQPQQPVPVVTLPSPYPTSAAVPPAVETRYLPPQQVPMTPIIPCPY